MHHLSYQRDINLYLAKEVSHRFQFQSQLANSQKQQSLIHRHHGRHHRHPQSSQSRAQKLDLRPSTPLHADTLISSQLLNDHLPAPAEGLLDASDAGDGARYRCRLHGVVGGVGALGLVAGHCGFCLAVGLEDACEALLEGCVIEIVCLSFNWILRS